MSERENVKNYFAGGNTAEGFYSLFEYISDPAEQVYIIKGGPGTGKSTLMKRMGNRLIKKGFGVEFHRCSSDIDSVDGLVCEQIKFAIMDGTAPHIVNSEFPGVRDQILNLGFCWDNQQLWNKREYIRKCEMRVLENFSEAYRYLNDAGTLYNHRAEFYQQRQDKKSLKQLVQKIWEDFNNRKDIRIKAQDRIRHLFASALTPSGIANYFEELTAVSSRRYILKGPSGSGKSWVMERLIEKAFEAGHKLTVFHCGFSPRTLDLVILNDINAAVMDGSPPHTVESIPEKDIVFDFKELGLINEFQNGDRNDLTKLKESYWKLIRTGLKYIKKAHHAHSDLERYFIEAMDFKKKERLEDILFNQVIETAEKRGYLD